MRETGAYNALTLRHEEVERQKKFEESAETVLLKLQDLTLDSMRAEEIGVALESNDSDLDEEEAKIECDTLIEDCDSDIDSQIDMMELVDE